MRYSLICLLSGVLLLGWSGAALGYDAAAHFDLTRDAMRAEGFSDTAIEVAQVTNWMCDYYEQASANPYSGYSDDLRRFLAGAWGARAAWPAPVVKAAGWLHFDNNTVVTVDGEPRGLEDGDGTPVMVQRDGRHVALV